MTPPGGQIIQAARPGGQIFNKCKWHHLVAYFHQLQVVSHGGRISMKYKNIFQEILLIRFVRNILFWKRNKKVLEDRDSRSCRHVSWFLLHHRETGGVIAHFQPTSSGKPSSISLFSSPGRGLCDLWYFWCYLVDKFPTDGSEANCQPNFKQLQVVSLGGQMLVISNYEYVWHWTAFTTIANEIVRNEDKKTV